MNHKQKGVLAAAVAATLGGVGVADAAIYTATLTGVATFSANGSSAGNISSSTATWEYDDVTGMLTQTGGEFNVRFTTAPFNTLFRHTTQGLVVGEGAAATASAFNCLEGNFGAGVGAHLCGNYLLGANFAPDSTTTWGPGTSFDRTMGGDDIPAGQQQNISAYDGMDTVSWVGTTLTLSNASATSGYQFTLSAGPQVIPVPAAVWLFGSALGLLGVARRKAAKA